MKLYSENEKYSLYEGNMLDMLDIIEPNSIDSIVTDPPYELNFMNRGWDNSGIAFKKETWEKCLQVLKPGGYMLVFGGSRTFHRIACAIEDAGFELRDTIMWIYGSGLAKGINLGLAIDKKNGVESKIIGKKNQTYPDYRDAGKQVTEKFGIDKLTFGQAENIKRKEVYAYEAQNEWNGWNSALKPAYEPILVCRKPFKGTLVDNVMKYGVGGINIDECRIPFQSEEDKKETTQKNQHEQFNSKPYDNSVFGDASMVHRKDYNTDGRFPANLILSYDETDAEEDISGFPHTKSTGGSGEKSIINNFANIYGDYSHNKPGAHLGGLGDEGSAARYFYCAKASKKDRNDGLSEKNPHVTVKPCSLMQYLVRLVTPKNGTVLDPFNGSGSTGKACMYENKERDANYKYIGIEITSEYLPVSEARINFAINANEKEEI